VSRAERLYNRMRRTKKGWGEKDFKSLYCGYGFTLKECAKHRQYQHPDFPDLLAHVGRHNELAPHYAETAVSLIDDLLEREADEEKKDEDEA
jgi:hypothetical protein